MDEYTKASIIFIYGGIITFFSPFLNILHIINDFDFFIISGIGSLIMLIGFTLLAINLMNR